MPVYLARVDVHSAVVSSATARSASRSAAEVGFRADGWCRREAHHLCRGRWNDFFTDAERRAAARVALRRCAELGVGTVHDLGGPHLGPYADLARVVDAGGELGLRVVSYWGEPATPSLIAEVTADGVRGLAGDLCMDGAIGSRTAWLSRAVRRRPRQSRRGVRYLSVEEITEHLRRAREPDCPAASTASATPP